MELVYNFYHGNSFGRSFVLVLFCCVFLLLLFLLVCCFLFVGLFSGVFFLRLTGPQVKENTALNADLYFMYPGLM